MRRPPRRVLKAELHFEEHPGQAYPAETIRTSQCPRRECAHAAGGVATRQRGGAVLSRRLRGGAFQASLGDATLRLPANTVLFRAAGLQVATVDADHKIKLKTIDQGRDFGKTIEILHGLDATDDVIVNPPDLRVRRHRGAHCTAAAGADREQAGIVIQPDFMARSGMDVGRRRQPRTRRLLVRTSVQGARQPARGPRCTVKPRRHKTCRSGRSPSPKMRVPGVRGGAFSGTPPSMRSRTGSRVPTNPCRRLSRACNRPATISASPARTCFPR